MIADVFEVLADPTLRRLIQGLRVGEHSVNDLVKAVEINQAEQTKQPPIIIERIIQASPQDVWQMWTTKDGLELWWGPEGFDARVLTLDLRAGGRLEIEVRATSPQVVKWMESQGAPLASV